MTKQQQQSNKRSNNSAAIDVLIVGAGPTGLVMASELARHGVACRIIDKSSTRSQVSKALVIQSRTLELFDSMDIIAEFLDLGTKVYAVNMYTNRKQLAHLTFDELNGPYPFMLDLAQSETERILEKRLNGFGLHVERQVELVKFVQTSDSVNLTLLHYSSSSNDGDNNNGNNDNQEELVRSSWLIGCDGAHSTVRHILNIPFSGATYPEHFALADIKLQWPLADNEAHVFLHKDGILAAFPLSNAVEERGGKRYRLLAKINQTNGNLSGEQNKEESDVEERQQEKKHVFSINDYEPTLRDFQRFINERVVIPINNKVGEGAVVVEEIVLSDLTWSSIFTINLRRAEQYKQGQGRVFLAGDAAHIHSPAGGQGMNTGIQDAYNLAWKLALVIKGHAHTSILDSYEAERRPVAESVLNMTDFLFRMGTSHDPASEQLRNHLFPLLAHPMVNQISELAINYRKSPIVSEYISNPSVIYDRLRATKTSIPKAGDRAPETNLVLLRDDNTTIRTSIFGILRDTKHILLLSSTTEDTESWKKSINLLQIVSKHHGSIIQPYVVIKGDSLKPSIKSIVTNDLQRLSIPIIFDSEYAFYNQFEMGSEFLYLVRPDGYIAYRSQPADSERLLKYLKDIII